MAKSSLYDEIYDITSQQRIDKWHAYLKQEHDLGKDWDLNYGINYTTSRDKSSQESNNKSSYGNTIQNEDQMCFYIGASKSFGQNSRWKHRSWKNITTPQSGMSGTSSLHSPSPIFQKLDTSSNSTWIATETTLPIGR